MKRLAKPTVFLLTGLVSAVAAAEAAPLAQGAVEYNRDVRPLLSDKCFFCHGPDKNHRKAGLRLDDRAAAIADGAIVPGKPEESELYKRLVTKDPDDLMPPPEAHKTLKADQIALLRRWIAQGAVYQPHWSYVPLRRPALPGGASTRHPVDAFVRQSLEARRLSPSPEADRRTLLRRLSLDLTGLPPTPEEVDAFVGDAGARAWERQIDRLLASPHFGERMAVPWLDLVRFADTVGYHGDQNQHVFPYRDYVIDSFNRNKPFDTFTIEQLAGDRLPRPTTEQLVATGFNRLNMVTREGGAQPKEYLAKYAADRVRAVGTVWLGSTLGCAECHDHKYDPITAKDFYSMAAFFADVKQWGVYADYPYTPNVDLKGYMNDHPFPPEVEAPSAYLAARAKRLEGEIKTALATFERTVTTDEVERKRLEAWQIGARRFLRARPDGWEPVKPRLGSGETASAKIVDDGVVLLEKREGKPKTETQRLVLGTPLFGIAALRLEAVPRPEHGGSILRGDGAEAGRDDVSLELLLERRGESGTTKLALAFGDSATKEARYAGGDEVLGTATGWRPLRARRTERQSAVFQLARPVVVGEGDTLTVVVRSNGLGAYRLSTSPFAIFSPPGSATPLAKATATLEPGRVARVALALGGRSARWHYLASSAASPAALARLTRLHDDHRACRGGRAPTLVTEFMPPQPVRVLARGNWQDESGEVVAPAVPHFLPAPPAAAEGRRLDRLDLARWIVSRENPLTARVFVNRLWKQLFGTGLSAVLDDVGAQGEMPSHPELLDWLATDFIDSGWDTKRLIKLLVTSQTYRQVTTLRPALAETDPGNRWLARQSPRRLDAEFVRDNALAIAGLLRREVGGPSVRPYQPEGYWENLQFPLRVYVPHDDDQQYRRGLYTHWQRTFVHPALANFDAPSREECTAERPASNTPQQALTLLNDPSFVEAARIFAARLLADRGARSDDARIESAFLRALARTPKPAEREGLRRFLGAQREHYAGAPEAARALTTVGFAPPATAADVTEQAAWTALCRVVLNLQETITRY